MPGRIKPIDSRALDTRVAELGAHIRQRRRTLGVSAAAAAEAANMSRVTWHRIEAGATSVTIAAWFNALAVLGLAFHLGEPRPLAADESESVPIRIRLADYPQLMALAWQVKGTDTLSPREAHDIYERNVRHIDWESITPQERSLLEALRSVYAGGS